MVNLSNLPQLRLNKTPKRKSTESWKNVNELKKTATKNFFKCFSTVVFRKKKCTVLRYYIFQESCIIIIIIHSFSRRDRLDYYLHNSQQKISHIRLGTFCLKLAQLEKTGSQIVSWEIEILKSTFNKKLSHVFSLPLYFRRQVTFGNLTCLPFSK